MLVFFGGKGGRFLDIFREFFIVGMILDVFFMLDFLFFVFWFVFRLFEDVFLLFLFLLIILLLLLCGFFGFFVLFLFNFLLWILDFCVLIRIEYWFGELSFFFIICSMFRCCLFFFFWENVFSFMLFFELLFFIVVYWGWNRLLCFIGFFVCYKKIRSLDSLCLKKLLWGWECNLLIWLD